DVVCCPVSEPDSVMPAGPASLSGAMPALGADSAVADVPAATLVPASGQAPEGAAAPGTMASARFAGSSPPRASASDGATSETAGAFAAAVVSAPKLRGRAAGSKPLVIASALVTDRSEASASRADPGTATTDVSAVASAGAALRASMGQSGGAKSALGGSPG